MHAGIWAKLGVSCDALVAVTAVLTILAARWVWFQAKLVPPDPGDTVEAPRGAATGVYAHPSMWVAVGLAVVQILLLLARHYPWRRLRVRGDSTLLALGSGLISLLVTADFLRIPGPWADILSRNGTFAVPDSWVGTPYALDGTTLFMTRTHGATFALEVALASLVFAVVSLAVTKAGTAKSDVMPVLLPVPDDSR